MAASLIAKKTKRSGARAKTGAVARRLLGTLILRDRLSAVFMHKYRNALLQCEHAVSEKISTCSDAEHSHVLSNILVALRTDRCGIEKALLQLENEVKTIMEACLISEKTIGSGGT